ncbi:STAS domain-containing protein [Alteromonas sp. ASW11-130]|uniref:STAS domain-containing protein n=1 Tax=Alteromonas sp. ASW11-130 TaxID=3015775 RepID=UPI0022422684|nr:STAS domain-containing protein [Alteromonas sp. ASW11-130]MCW8091470.1 STAS domain-containing protein [Alteromonas sp. ASW11-130]
MAIKANWENANKALIIKMDEKFDYSKVQEFRHVYTELSEPPKEIRIDLADTQYMDSSALGMLLNMQKHFCDKDKTVNYKIINSRPQVARILKISRFDKKFDIS